MKFMPVMLVNVFCATVSVAFGWNTIAIVGVLLTILMVLLFILYALFELKLELIKLRYMHATKQKESFQTFDETVP